MHNVIPCLPEGLREGPVWRMALIGALIVLGAVEFAWAGRPLSTEDAGTVERGRFEFEIGAETAFQTSQENETGVGLVCKHGITERMDCFLGLPYGIQADQSGWGPAAFGCKWHVLPEKGHCPDCALVWGTEAGSASSSLCGACQRTLGKASMMINLGYGFSGTPLEKGVGLMALGAEYPLGKSSRVGLELTGEYPGASEEKTLQGLAGIAFPAGKAGMIDFGLGLNINNAESDWFITAGFVFER